jgi:ribosomal protein S27E
MADTVMGDFADIACTDCGDKPSIFKHWGHLVPSAEVGHFCGSCMKTRAEFYRENGSAKPIDKAQPSK